MADTREIILNTINKANLTRTTSEGFDIPDFVKVDQRTVDNEDLDKLFQEIEKLSGRPARINLENLQSSVDQLVVENQICSAMLWQTQTLHETDIQDVLFNLGVQILSPYMPVSSLEKCDLGITEVDYAIAETGTLVLLSSPQKPRLVSLLPRIHLAILKPSVVRMNLQQVIYEIKDCTYAVFITGPSRTADIELTVTLGVHGPQSLIVWILE